MPPANLSLSPDMKLLRLYAQTRDASAFSSLVETYSDMVYATCLRILRNVAEAEDASQECFLRLARDSAKIHTSIAAWLHRSATNECISRIRQLTATASRERRYEVDRQEGKRSSSTWPEIFDQVDAALEELPEDLRHILVAHFLQRRSQTELAEELGLSPATMSRRVSDGVALIRKKLSRTGFIISAVALGVVLLEQTAQAAPVALVSNLGKMAMVGPPVGPTLWMKVLHVVKSKLVIGVAGGGIAAGVVVYWGMRDHEKPPLAPPHQTVQIYPTGSVH